MLMIINFTKNDLTRYVYNELNGQENSHLETATLIDNNVGEYCEGLHTIIKEIDNCMIEPTQKSIDAIMQYAKKSKLGA
jgi:hypothetical protein